MFKKVFILLFVTVAASGLFAQVSDFECEINISPNDTIFYTNHDTVIYLSIDNIPNFSITWYGEDINVSDSLHPFVTLPVNQTRQYSVSAIYENEENLIVNRNFENGNTGFYSALNYVSNTGTQALWNEGTYSIGTNPNNYHLSWINATHQGNMLIANGATNPGVTVYQTTINIQPYTDYVVKFEAANIDNGATSSNVASFQFSINDQMVGDIFTISQNVFQWNWYYQTWSNGSNSTAKIRIVNQNTTGEGNDFAIDNIEVHELCEAYSQVILQSISYNYDTIIASICQGETYSFRDTSFFSECVYNDTVVDDNGISITTLILNVEHVYNETREVSICENEVYNFYGRELREDGEYIQNMQSINGCDSTITLHLNVNTVYNDTIQASVCEGEVFNQDGFNETVSGFYTHEFMTDNGCDSIISLNLKVNPVYRTEYRITQNNEVPYTEHGFYADSSDAYIQELLSKEGCDSTVTLHFRIESPISIMVPTAFRPAQEGNNNINHFFIYPNTTDIEIYKFQIFDRWGTLVFESNDVTEGWNGKYKGSFCPQGVYIYNVFYFSKSDPGYVKDKSGNLC